MRYLSFFILAVIPALFMSFSSGQNDEKNACDMMYDPVCALTQIQCITTPCDPIPETYGNSCMMEAANAEFLYQGECDGHPYEEEPTMCTMQYDPVCGVNGVTYGNVCSAGKNPIAYAGECALPDLQYCAAYYDGCNNCSVEDGQIAACTLMYCESPAAPRCTEFVETVKRNDMVLIDKQRQTQLSTIFHTITAVRNSLDNTTQAKYYKALSRAFDARVKEWKDFAMVASFTPEGYAQFQKKIIIYAYLHHITQEKIALLAQ